jgi:hypothetical protein
MSVPVRRVQGDGPAGDREGIAATGVGYGTDWPKAVAQITDDRQELVA